MTNEMPFEQLFTIMRRRRSIMILSALIATVAAVSLGAWLPAHYTATALLVVQFASTIPNPQSSAAENALVQTHIAALDAPNQLVDVLTGFANDAEIKAALDSDHARHPKGSATGRASTQVDPAFIMRYANLLWRNLVGDKREKDVARLENLNVEKLRRRLRVQQEHGSNAISVSMTWTDPDLAAAFANRAVRVYLEREKQRAEEDLRSLMSLMDTSIREERATYDRAHDAAEAYRAAHMLADQRGLFDQHIAELQRQLVSAEVELASRKTKLARARASLGQDPGRTNAGEFANSPAINDLRHEELGLVQSQSELATALGPTHPRMQAIAAGLREVRSKLAHESGSIIRSLEADERSTESGIATLQGQITAAQRIREQASGDSHVLADLEHTEDIHRQAFENLQQRQQQLAERQNPQRIRLLSLAKPPERASSPAPILFIPPAIIAFITLGGLLAILTDRLDRSIRGERDVWETLGVPCLTFVPRLTGRSRAEPHKYLTNHPLAPYAEALRSLAAGMDLPLDQAHGKVLLISSSLPGEGKTTLATSIAVQAAKLGGRILLLDVDCRRSSSMREVCAQSEDAAALSPFMRLGTETIEHVSGLGIDYLRMRNRGLDPLLPYSRDTLPRFIDSLRRRYDWIVVDGPPLLVVAEARMLAKLSDKILFVVKWGSTTREIARAGHALLLTATAASKILGVVVTQVDVKRHARGRYGGLPEYLQRYRSCYTAKADLIARTEAV